MFLINNLRTVITDALLRDTCNARRPSGAFSKMHAWGRLGVKATNSKAKARGVKAKALTSKAKDLASKAKDLTAKDLAPHPPIRSRPRKVFTVHYITLIIAALSKSLDDDASMCRK